MSFDRQIIVEVGGVDFTGDTLSNVQIDMGARTAWEQNVAGLASIVIQQDDPGVVISDEVRVRVEAPDTPEASGGTESTITVDGIDYRLHVFTEDGTFTVTNGGEVEYLIVGGGGAGANYVSGFAGGAGGGAGGVRAGTLTVNSGTHSVIVGSGGTPTTSTASLGDGESSSVFGITAAGGGGGGGSTGSTRNGAAGGSGGGGGADGGFGGTGTSGQGNDGGDGPSRGTVSNGFLAGGGGGASVSGSNGGTVNNSTGGAGGDGISNSITGTAVVYAGGGGGSAFAFGFSRSCTGGAGGNGGGGAGMSVASGGSVTSAAVAGTDGLGGGGGGGGNSTGSDDGADGGNGIVIIRYRDTYQTVFTGRVDTTSAQLTDLGPLWTITASGPLTKAGRRELTGIIAADTDGDQIALLAQEALGTQWDETSGDWAAQTRTWDGFAVDTSAIDQPGQYALAAIDELPANVVDAMTTAAFSGSGWLYETAGGLLGFADSTHRELLPASAYITVPGSATSRNDFITVTQEADIANDLIVEYDGGEVTGKATDSMPIYGRWQRTYTTTLADQSAAEQFLTRRLQLEGAPRLNIAGSIFIDLDQVDNALMDRLLTVERNTGIILEDVPTYIEPEGLYRGFVEGYRWSLGPIESSLELFVSEYSLSNFGLRWNAAGPTQWNGVAASLTWQDATEALA